MRPPYLSTLGLFVLAASVAFVGYTSEVPKLDPPPPLDGPTPWAAAALSESPSGPRLQDIFISHTGVGITVGTGRRIWRTTDGGRQWTAQRLSRPVGVGVAMREDGVGVIVGGAGDIHRTTDHGATWQLVESGVDEPLDRVAFISEDQLIAVGRLTILCSRDSGLTWQQVDSPPVYHFDLAVRAPVAVAVGGGGSIVRSSDACESWEAIDLGLDNMLRGVAFADSATAVAVGSDGLILRSSDAGRSWARIDSGTLYHLRSVAFADPKNGLAAGYYGTVLRTADGGLTWTPEESGTRTHLFDVTMDPGGVPFAVGWFDTIIIREPLVTGSRGEAAHVEN